MQASQQVVRKCRRSGSRRACRKRQALALIANQLETKGLASNLQSNGFQVVAQQCTKTKFSAMRFRLAIRDPIPAKRFSFY
jgi:hypothetical protein